MTRPSITDTELNAYLDGEFAGGRCERVEQVLAQEPALAEQLAAYRRTDQRLRAELDAVVREPIPEALLALLVSAETPPWHRRLPAIAAAIALFLAGAAGGWLLRPQPAGVPEAISTAELAIAAHRIFVSEVRHPVEVGADQRDHLVTWLSKRLGAPLDAPDLTAAGFGLVGGRLLPAGETAAAQFMYENAAKERITLYVAANLPGGQTAFKLAGKGDVRSFYWLDGRFGYAITGAISESALLALANSAYDQLTRSPPGDQDHRT